MAPIKLRRQELVLAVMRTRLRQLLLPDEIIALDPGVVTEGSGIQYQREQVRTAIYALQHDGYPIQIEKRDGKSAYRLLSDLPGDMPVPAKKFVVGYEFRSRSLAQQMAAALSVVSGRKAKIYEL